MAIIKKVPDPDHPGEKTKHLVLPAFSFQPTDGLANLIINAWAEGPASPGAATASTPTAAAAPSAATKGQSLGERGRLLVEDIKRRQADVKDFLLAKKDFMAL